MSVWLLFPLFSLFPSARAWSSGCPFERNYTPAHLQADATAMCDNLQNPAQKILKQIQQQGFQCQASGEQKNVQKCVGRLPGYPERVLMYVPNSLDESQTVQMVYHFHGHTDKGVDSLQLQFNEKTGTGDFASWMEKAKLNGVIIAPISQGDCITFKAFFNDPSNTKSFFAQTENIVKGNFSDETRIKLAVTSASGGDIALNALAKTMDPQTASQVRQIGLFDSLFNLDGSAVDWAQKNKMIAFDSYVAGGATQPKQPQFLNSLQRAGIPTVDSPVSSQVASHFSLMSTGQYTQFLEQL